LDEPNHIGFISIARELFRNDFDIKANIKVIARLKFVFYALRINDEDMRARVSVGKRWG